MSVFKPIHLSDVAVMSVKFSRSQPPWKVPVGKHCDDSLSWWCFAQGDRERGLPQALSKAPFELLETH